jgi:hypothetical protein
MSESAANVLVVTAATATGPAWVDALAAAIDTHGLHWIVRDTAPGKVLLECIATARQVVFAGAAGLVQGSLKVGMSVTPDMTSADDIPSSGLRSVTGQNNLVGGAGAEAYVVEYEDAIGIVLKSPTQWLWAGFAGRLVNPIDESDYARGLGDAVMTGRPTDVAATPSWLVGSSTYSLDSPVVRTPTGWVLMGNGFRLASTSAALSRVGDTERLVPYQVFQLGAGMIGHTRYLRQFRSIPGHESRLFSNTVGSQQAWIGYDTPAQTGEFRNRVLLWNKEVTTV